jgi:hypothetical protein
MIYIIGALIEKVYECGTGKHTPPGQKGGGKH